jgi:hypothetical protein
MRWPSSSHEFKNRRLYSHSFLSFGYDAVDFRIRALLMQAQATTLTPLTLTSQSLESVTNLIIRMLIALILPVALAIL